LLHTLLEFIVHNFDEDSPEDQRWLGMLFDREASLMRSGAIGSDFSVLAATVKPGVGWSVPSRLTRLRTRLESEALRGLAALPARSRAGFLSWLLARASSSVAYRFRRLLQMRRDAGLLLFRD
jgi:hypothetical protein